MSRLGRLNPRSRRRGKPRYPIPLWNLYQRVLDDLPRTNNAPEGWHGAVNRAIGYAHPTVSALVKFLQYEQSSVEVELLKIQSGILSQKYSKKLYEEIDKHIKEVVPTYGTIPIVDYLKRIGRHFK